MGLDLNNDTPRAAFRSADFETLLEGLDYAATTEKGFTFHDARGHEVNRLSYRMLRDDARALAVKLAGRFRQAQRVALIADSSPEFLTAFFACQYAGLAPAPVPAPFNLGGAEKFETQLGQMLASAKASAFVAPDAFSRLLEPLQDRKDFFAATYSGLNALKGEGELPEIGPDDICYIQYSSGSTRAPKGVVSTHRSAVSNIRGILNAGLRCGPDDKAVSWLPLYHDMGLVGFIMSPMMCQMPVALLSTFDFVRRPMTWPRLIAETGATISYSPSFGYDLCARRAASEELDGLDLSSWRAAGIGGDMVRPEVLERFADTFAAARFDPKAYLPSYGLAEATVAVSFVDPETAPDIDEVDLIRFIGEARAAAPKNETDKTRRFVSCGRALPGHQLEIRRHDGLRTNEREVGHIYVKGPSNCRGYFGDPEETARLIDAEGWMATGDMGYLAEGELYVTGRSKDLILHHGRNIWPQDIEWSVEKLPNVRSGSVAAFAVEPDEGEEAIVAVIATGLKDETERTALAQEARAAIQKGVGAPARVVLAPGKAMVLTSSGKLSRAKVKARYLSGEFEGRADAEALASAAE